MASLNREISGRALYPKGPDITLETFSKEDFIVRDFIEELADEAVPKQRRSGPAQQAFGMFAVAFYCSPLRES